jgi:hypothetical protein
LTQKALSQLPIVSSVDIVSGGKSVQLKSKLLGSEGAIEVIGGSANKAKFYVSGETEVSTDDTGSYLLAKIAAYPDTISIGDFVKLENDAGVKRLSRLKASDRVDVVTTTTGTVEYRFNPKQCNFSSSTSFTIDDVSHIYSKPAKTVWRWMHSGNGATLASVFPGDLLIAFGVLQGWSQGNKALKSGDGESSGFPVVAVNDSANWIDVVNPYGQQMAATQVGQNSKVQVCPAAVIKWNLDHAANIKIASVSRASGVVTVTCQKPHFLNSGDSVQIRDSDNVLDGVYSNVLVQSITSFTFSSAGPAFYEGNVNASLIKATKTPTRYKIKKLGFNGLTRLSRVDGESPRFVDCGVAVDDYLVINGSTFKSNNNGRFRVLALDNDSLVFVNETASEETNTYTPFNNKGILVNWTSNSNLIYGVAGAFKNLSVGDWVKKEEDDDAHYLQVISFDTSNARTATQVVLGGNYKGSTAAAAGTAYDQVNGFGYGNYLDSNDDIAVYEGDSTVTGDTLYVQNIVDNRWFNVNNVGSFVISEVGFDAVTYKPFLRVNNSAGISETDRQVGVSASGFYTVESLTNKFYSIREVSNVAIDDANQEKRAVYMTHSSKSYKFSESNKTSLSHMGKLGYSTDVTTGIDGYLYYTGLLRRVQRVVDGYEPDAENFPGRRAVGGIIEILPPLIKQISISVDVTTNEGVNLGDISNNIKSTIINYVQKLSVGEDVVVSEIIAAIMQIKGVGAVTFTSPAPSTERIAIADNEKATIMPENIGIA